MLVYTNCTSSLVAPAATSYHMNGALYSQHTAELEIYIEIHIQMKYHHSTGQIQLAGQNTQMGFLSFCASSNRLL